MIGHIDHESCVGYEGYVSQESHEGRGGQRSRGQGDQVRSLNQETLGHEIRT